MSRHLKAGFGLLLTLGLALGMVEAGFGYGTPTLLLGAAGLLVMVGVAAGKLS